ncbi:MAG TPA: BTAD domain-containing putative transcriptional regulator [Solirubrobacteraceae bacterium]
MRFRLLGPLEIDDDGRRVDLDPPKERALLAVLLLQRGRPLTVDRLVDALWEDDAPATAAKAVQVYVGHLRRALGAESVRTTPGGYAFATDAHEVDVERFEETSGEGRRLLDAGDADAAAARLRESLALWRGAPLAEFAYARFAQDAIAGLEEDHLATLEARIDADLALGEDARLVPELQGLVRAHPLRERLHAQLMLALSRSGRQADALAAYADVRRRLVDELGLEPGAELREAQRAVLAQEGAAVAPAPRSPPAGRTDPSSVAARRRRIALVAVAGTVAAGVAVALLVSRGGDGTSPPVRARGDSVAVVDPVTGRLVDDVAVGRSPTAVAAGEGAVWALNADDRTISRIDVATRTQRTFGIGATPTDLAAGEGALWVGNGGSVRGAQFAGAAAMSLARLDPTTAAVRSSVLLPRGGRIVSNAVRQHVAFAGGAVWAIAPDASVARLDPATNRITARVGGLHALALAAAGDELWALADDGDLARIEPARGRVARRVRVPAVSLTSIAVGGGAVWGTDPFAGVVWRVDSGRRPLQRTIDVGRGVDAVAFGAGRAWASNGARGTLTGIDARTNRVGAPLAIGGVPTGVAVTHDAVWVAVARGADAPAVETKAGAALPSSVCGAVVAGSASPDRLVVSDLPLQGGPRFPTLQMSAAILDVLRRHDFRAGRFALGYQSCDDSTPRTGLFDEAKCAANAKAYARTPAVAGVVGPFNSGCAVMQIPVASRAGLPLISPTATDPGLTHDTFGLPPGALDALYPGGRRSFARLLPPDDAQGAALAMLVEHAGARRPVVIDDGGYGSLFAAYARRALRRLRLPAVAALRWDARRPEGYGRLVRRAVEARADAVVLCGLVDTDAGAVLKALRAALPDATVVGCDGLLPASLLFERAGAAARGVLVATSGVGIERLPSVGRAFVRRFGATQPGRRVDVAAVYAAQATEVLLAAIARSDGSRNSIRRALLATRVRGGLIGDFGLDDDGDPEPAPVTVYRLVRPAGDDAIQSTAGAEVHAVLRPSLHFVK